MTFNPTAPATKRTRPDGWLAFEEVGYACPGFRRMVLGTVWHWLPNLTAGVAACGARPNTIDLRNEPGAVGTICKACRAAADGRPLNP